MANESRVSVFATEELLAEALPASRDASQDLFDEWWSRRQGLIDYLDQKWRIRKSWRDASADLVVEDSFDSPDSLFVGITRTEVATPLLVARLQEYVRRCGSSFSITLSIDDAIMNAQLPLFWVAIYSDRIYCFSDDAGVLHAFGLS